jgi:serine/threonine protein kinase
LDAIGYLHEKNIVYNDIKDENIIVTTELKVTIIDFGSASFDNGEKTR